MTSIAIARRPFVRPRLSLLALALAALPSQAAELPILFDPLSAEVPRSVAVEIAGFARQAQRQGVPLTVVVPGRGLLAESRRTALRAQLAQLGLDGVRETPGSEFKLTFRDPAPVAEPVREAMADKTARMQAQEASLRPEPLWPRQGVAPAVEPPRVAEPRPAEASVAVDIPPPPAETAAREVSPPPEPAAPLVEFEAVLAPPPEPPPPQWHAGAGSTLRQTLDQWATTAGWQVEWTGATDYPLAFSADLTGDFAAAAAQLVDGFWRARPRPHITFFANKVAVAGAQP